MANGTPETNEHSQWMGLLRPVGLVVSTPALRKAECYPDKNVLAEQQALLRLVRTERLSSDEERVLLPEIEPCCRDVLHWEVGDVLKASDAPALFARAEVPLPEHGEVLRPDYIVPSTEDRERPLVLVQVHPCGMGLDDVDREATGWLASPQDRIDRLLRETGVPIGLLFNGCQVRLVYAPRGEATGHLTFPIEHMCSVSGRPILSALLMLLRAERLFVLEPPTARLPSILRESRKYQQEVSKRLSGQVGDALRVLLQGFEAADATAGGAVLEDLLDRDPHAVYSGLVSALLASVVVLYMEDKGLAPAHSLYTDSYSLGGLCRTLQGERAALPDMMELRFGAWARVLSLFRITHSGARHGTIELPARRGRLFDHGLHPFLHGRDRDLPPVSDRVVVDVLEKLLFLDGDRLSYQALDVERIGSVYESLMGFEIGPDEAAPGRHVLRESKERQLSGSRMTPRSVAEPLVREALRPVLARFGATPKPEEILSIRVCDPAVGSGAFLVSACRVLAEALVAAWSSHGGAPSLAPGEDLVVHARRQVAEHCLFGIDKNPLAVELAKVSLWLLTLSHDKPFTSLDLAIRTADSLLEGSPFDDDFDVVVTNPPFVRYHLLEEEAVARFASSYELARGQFDLFALFLERAEQMIEAGGTVGMVFPSLILRGTSWSTLRRFILERFEIVELQEHEDGTFEDVQIPTCHLILRKAKASRGTTTRYVRGSETLQIETDMWARDPAATFVVADRALSSLIAAFAKMPTLGEKSLIRRGHGIGKTHTAFAEEAGGKRVPCVTGSELAPFRIAPPRWLDLARAKLKASDGRAGSTRVLVRETGADLLAAVCPPEIHITRSVYAIEPDGIDPWALAAILNSDVGQWWYRATCIPDSGVFPKLRIAQLKRFPIPPLQDAPLVTRLSEIARALSTADDPVLRTEMNGIVAKLYGRGPA